MARSHSEENNAQITSPTLSADFSRAPTPIPTSCRGARHIWRQWFEEMRHNPSSESFVYEVNGNPRTDVFLVLRFDMSGKYTYEDMSRNDVLQIIRQAEKCASPQHDELRDSPTHRAKRSEAVGVSRLGAYVDLQPVHMRDLRQLDESYSESNETEFVIRKQAILVNADPIRAIILRDATLVFVPEGADGLLSMLIKDFHECVATKGGNAPFEFRALEAILDTIERLLNEEYDQHAGEINQMLDTLLGVSIMSGELETLRLMKNDMSAFQAHVDSIRRAIRELLDNEEDLRLLYLTKLYNNPSLIYDLGSFDPEEVEILIESYLKDIYTTRTKADLLQHRVQTTESLITMKLDYARNYLLALQLIFSLVGIGLGIGTLITGIFGMNLPMNIPSPKVALWVVCSSIVIGTVGVIWGGMMYFRRQGLLIAI